MNPFYLPKRAAVPWERPLEPGAEAGLYRDCGLGGVSGHVWTTPRERLIRADHY